MPSFVMGGRYHSTLHNHPLEMKGKRNTGWNCDAKNTMMGCRSGITDFGQTLNINDFRCDQCNFDLCENCMISSLKPRIQLQPDFVFEVGDYYFSTVHKHPLLDRGQIGGWSCDGAKEPGGCRSKINGVSQSAGKSDFRCNQCNYDLCEVCMAYHFDHDKNHY